MGSSNAAFFVQQAGRGLRLNWIPNVVSIICIALALVSVALLTGVWWNLEHVLEAARADAQIVLYLDDSVTEARALTLRDFLLAEPGALSADMVSREEALASVDALLGGDFDLADLFDEANPFTLSIEVGVRPESAGEIAALARSLAGVEMVRDNEEILTPLISITRVVRWVGSLALLGVALTAFALISHLIRLGIAARREEMETLRLLGASEGFVACPFLIEGTLLGGAGALLAWLMVFVAGIRLLPMLHTSLPFLPLLPPNVLVLPLSGIIGGLGIVSGFLGAVVALRARG